MDTGWNPQSAQQAYQVAATVVIADAPAGAHFGIDVFGWTTGERFKGVKLVPPGIHFLWLSIPNKEGGPDGPRIGFFTYLEPKQVVVRKWDKVNEEWFPINKMDGDEVDRFTAAVKSHDLDSFLGAYPIEKFKKWRELSNFITHETLRRIVSGSGSISSNSKKLTESEEKFLEMSKTNSELKSEHEFYQKFADGIPVETGEDARVVQKILSEDLNDYASASNKFSSNSSSSKSLNSDALNFLRIPKHKIQPGASASEITRLNMDKSAILEDLVRGLGSENELLAEFQFAFLVFFVGQSYDGFEHWKALFEVISRANKAFNSARFITGFVSSISAQIAEVSDDFFEDIVSGNNFLLTSLREVFKLIDQSSVLNKGIKQSAESLKSIVEKRFQVSLSVEEISNDFDDDLPSIANIDELRAMGISDEDIQKLLRQAEED